jgi:site-specific recombinase XerD
MAEWGISDLPTWKTIEAALAPSTRRAYSATFQAFLRFIDTVGRDMDTVGVVDVLSFLQEYVDKRRAKSTIRAAHAALAHFFTLFKRDHIIRSPIISLHVLGAQRLAPVNERVPFIWDPEIPLNFIANRPFPHLFRPAGKEALLLLLLSTGIRVSDAHRLSKKMVKTGAVWSIPYLEARKTGESPPQSLHAYHNARLCPVRALQRYLVLANPIRKPRQPFMFISSRGVRADVDTLRQWVTEILAAAGISAPAGSCRSASTSAAANRNMDIDHILKAAGWARESTFRRFYHRAIHPSVDGETLLPPVE